MPYQQYNFKPQTFDAQKKRPDLRLLYISHSSYDKTWPSVLHSHPFTELFYVLNGTGTFQTETQTFCIAADDLILINPHVMHTEFSNGDAALEYVVLGFEGIAFETDGHAPITCLCKNVKTIRPACLFYTRSLIQELHDRKENYVEMSQNLLENLLYLIRREIRRHAGGRLRRQNLTGMPHDRAVHQCALRGNNHVRYTKCLNIPQQILHCPRLHQIQRNLAHQLSDYQTH